MEGRSFGGRYLLQREIGRGGMGCIWEAIDQQLDRRVAVKVIMPEHADAAQLRGLLEREARAIARLNNPHVVQVFDYGMEDGWPYVVMEFLTGEDLQSRLDRHERLPLAVIAKLVAQIAQALAAAHEAGIVHRDLKPGNVFLVRGDEEERLKVLDFGVVSLLAEPDEGAAAGYVAGTPAYMSPEQLRSARPDSRSDVWALGIITYRMLTGQLPFGGEGLGDLVVRICMDPFVPPTQRVPELPPTLDRFFERALAKDPAQRFQSAREFNVAFAAALATANTGGRNAVKILVVDDEPDVPSLIRQHFRRQIRQSVYQFVFADNGETALDALHRNPDIDVVLSDINMPGMDGLTFLGHVGEVNPIVRTVIVSAYSDTANIRVAMNRGAFDFLVKPIDFQDLDVTIQKTWKHVAELRHKQRSDAENHTLRSLVSPSFLARLDEEGMQSALAGQVIEGTVMVVDLRLGVEGAVAREGEAEVRAINANFDVVVPEVLAHGGCVEQFAGEQVVVSFIGASHIERALAAAAALRRHLAAIATRAGKDSPYARNSAIALASGPISTCMVGSRTFNRLEYRVSGWPVRVAFELVREADAGEVLATANVRATASEYLGFESLGARPLSCLGEPIEVLRVLFLAVPAGVDVEGATVLY